MRLWALELVDVGDEGLPRRFDPLAVVGDMSVDAHSTEDRVAVDFRSAHAFENAFGDDAEILPAASHEAGSVGVVIEGGATGEFILFRDTRRLAPTEEIVLDLFALRMIADGAFAGVAIEIGSARGGSAAGG
ncbi:MAG TPA: hypothetical protein VJN21_12615 [Candidatus Acidoferrales bacterium]|nr:hypothetical protein [Candidatus Acidoferrales bacterium]